ncbi:hypothetical protein H4R20_005434 [Coemansia guatemalensis]|uniref:Fungal-type protein kinase domain-containing protein n=1 Tax=Coemansia guatemalensis TaxID=2761395 RepID=A0A9W8LQT1_9FUNG|nr:hypothetical protein H4R20_005434 [Coemansia guatemalensis]
MFGIIEAKVASSEASKASALLQVHQYTKNAYGIQHNRRFSWAMTAMRTDIQAYVFGPNLVLELILMDVMTCTGCKELIQLLVYWLFCELHSLGYDPMVQFNHALGCIEIDIPIDDGDDKLLISMYYPYNVVVAADHLFGQHMRCFLAIASLPAYTGDPEFKESIIIKDAWPEAPEKAKDINRDEIQYLQQIKEGLNNYPEFDGLYPNYEGGGHVCIQRLKSDYAVAVEDTTESIVGDNIWSQISNTALQVHK